MVKQLRERGFKTPIVAVTAYAMVGDRERCIEAGCNSYLSKPLPVAELVELVQKYELRFKEPSAATPEVKPAPAAAKPVAPAVEAPKPAAPAAEVPKPPATPPAGTPKPAAARLPQRQNRL